MATKSADHRPPAKPSRRDRAQGRREAILVAALAEFSEKGLAAARIEDIARRAEVGKGTIYLHFADKEALFTGIVRAAIVPVVEMLTRLGPEPEESVHAFLRRVLVPAGASLGESPRRDVVRLLLSEGPRYPAIAAMYFREVVSPGLARIADLAALAAARGETDADSLQRFPQLVIAPVLLGVIWNGLFATSQPLDVKALIEAQVDLLFARERS
jgi:AcrR family transcriptional regulator